jgi:hypothetical protein
MLNNDSYLFKSESFNYILIICSIMVHKLFSSMFMLFIVRVYLQIFQFDSCNLCSPYLKGE